MFATRDRYPSYYDLRYLSTDMSLLRHNLDVVIKLVQKGDEGRSEYEILHLLNSVPLHDHPVMTMFLFATPLKLWILQL